MVRMFLVTANVGSVFENVEKGQDVWLNEFISVISSKGPEFVAVHFQETGGKGYENGSIIINQFFGQLVERMGQINFRRAEGFVDSRSDLEDQFTALSSIYFVHESVQAHAVAIWDFQDNSFKDVPSPAKIHAGSDLDRASRKQKEKFPLNFYPNCKWSRKGFLRTRWRINGKILDLVNIHLFHDIDNLIAASSFPSQFSQSRERALKYTLKMLQSDSLEKCPLFIFGDFNFRVDTQGVMTVLTKEFGAPNDEFSGVSIGTKQFSCPEQELRFLYAFDWLKKYDFEVKRQDGVLQEFDLQFPPTYPFEEDEGQAEKFLKTRCPAWCDRVLFTHPAKDIISEESPVEYNVLGSKASMGDHKPVYLSFIVKSPTSHSSIDLSDSHGKSSGKVGSHCKLSSVESSGPASSRNSNPNSSTLGTPQPTSRTCKCLVSLIKCNLNFPKSRLLSRGSSSDSVVTNPSIPPNNNCNGNGTQKHTEESQKFCRHFCSKKSIWRYKQNTNEIIEDKTTSDLIQTEPLITDKPSNKRDLSSDQLILPFSLPVEKDGSSKNRDIMSVGVPLNIQNLNVISSNSEKSSGKNLESSKLHFGWTRRQRSNEKNKNLNTSKESDSLLCSKCVIL